MSVFQGAEALAPAPPSARDDAHKAQQPDYTGMTVAQLRAECAERGVKVPAKATKARLVELLEG